MNLAYGVVYDRDGASAFYFLVKLVQVRGKVSGHKFMVKLNIVYVGRNWISTSLIFTTSYGVYCSPSLA